MELVFAVVIAVLFGAGLFLMMRRSLVKLVLGIAILSQGANLLIFLGAGLTRENPPFIDPEALALHAGAADPLPQALILTAIVIAFGVLAFTLVLARQAYLTLNTDDLDALKHTDT